MALDEIENELRCAAGERVHAAAQLLAELTLHLVRIVLETGIDLTAVSAGCAPARFLGLQHTTFAPCSARCRAVDNPVMPPPTTTTSARTSSSRAGVGVAGSAVS